MGIEVELTEDAPIITQRIFTNEDLICFFTYQASWDGDDSQIKLKRTKYPNLNGFHLVKQYQEPFQDLMYCLRHL